MSQPDPFGVRSHVANAAISKHHTLAPDVYECLFETVFFQSEVFTTWSQGDRMWSLHCYGDPGCGKTTLAAIAVRRLRVKNASNGAAQVISIFIKKDISTSAAMFLEDLLQCAHQQLPSAGPESECHFEQYATACRNGESIVKRTRLLRAALNSRLDANPHTFLVLDGYDQIGEGLQFLLDHELAALQEHRLRVLLTRRVPTFELPLETNCDGTDCETPWRSLKLFWACKPCSKDPETTFALCYACKAKGQACRHHGVAYLEEDYDHVNIGAPFLDVSLPDDLREFVAWDMQTCLGTFAAEPRSGAFVLPDSAASVSSAEDGVPTPLPVATERLEAAIEFIANTGNVTIAKMYLDNIHKHQSLDVVLKRSDRFPRNIIALFDAAIERIKQQPKHDADIALMAIAAAATQEHGITIVMLEDWMRDALSRLSHLACAPPRSIEDILRCTNGYIFEDNYDVDNRLVKAYCPSFARYIKENYNDTLFWYRSQLNIRRASRSLTGLYPTQPKLTSPPIVASPPSMDGAFDSTVVSGIKHRPQQTSPEYFDRSFKASGFPFPPKSRSSLPTLPGSAVSELGVKKLTSASRSYTMQLAHKRDFRTEVVGIQEEVSPTEPDKPRLSRSIHKPASRVCSFCEIQILGSKKLRGTYKRLYSSLSPLMVKKCIFCSILYHEFLVLSKADREQLEDIYSPIYHWTIRTTARSRESKNSMVVSFHQAHAPKAIEPKVTSTATPVTSANSSSKTFPLSQCPRRFHLLPENDLGHVPTKDDVGSATDPSNKAVGRQLINWIENCNQNHPKCIKAAKTTYVPTRLLDLQFGDLSSVRLIKTAEEGTKGPYVTLSHCWGPNEPYNKFLCTYGETEEEYKTKGVKVSALSKNFQQAISVARHIGVRYIWIDSLCIIQGAKSDFATEGHFMHKVYRNSYCNFAAAVSKDSHGGLFRNRDPADVIPGRYKGDGSSAIFGATQWRIVPENLWETDLLDTSIYTRGWVFQERMLSPRILHFASKQVFWDCGTVSACETLPSGLPLALDDSASKDRHWRGRLQESSSLAHAPLSGVNDDSLGGFWSASVLRYTQCDLTNQSDKSVAIWSIAKLVRDAWSDEYGAGVWSLALEEQLSWKVVRVRESLRSIDLQWRQPSWSWTSMQGAISLPERVKAERCYTIKGHDNEPISFKTKESVRPILEREHSGSIKEDLDMGWKEWQKKTRAPSLPQLRKDHMGERSQSMPIGQKPAATEMQKKPKVEVKTDPRDLEPELETKSIAIHAPIATGTLHPDATTESYTFKLSTATTSQDIAITAFPDETPSPENLHPNPLHFLVLTATQHSTYLTPNGLGIDTTDPDYDSDNEPELPMQTTYSGTGLLVLPATEYLQQHRGFESEIGVAERKLAAAKGEWAINEATKGVEGLKKWVGEMAQERHWRRVGVVEFAGWSQEVYDMYMRMQKEKYWLD